ncbi:NAD(P)H-dependent oxidoreductase [Paenibacillus sp. SI8]|uniref:NAD(P)H-dependent oxidoreductase n=1 Tax=unclassified Paenibacillus TaxID=185978 RepID=UPI003467D371
MKIMVIVAHPDLSVSGANQAFASELKGDADITVRDLYKEYPNWHINVEKEHELLLAHDRIVLQFPLYWYSCPPLLKKWFDDVFTYGWAFGPQGDNLQGKEFVVATTTGGSKNAYRSGGENWFTISELLRPIQSTLTKCNATYLPAFVAYEVTRTNVDYVAEEAKKYSDYIRTPQTALVQ